MSKYLCLKESHTFLCHVYCLTLCLLVYGRVRSLCLFCGFLSCLFPWLAIHNPIAANSPAHHGIVQAIAVAH